MLPNQGCGLTGIFSSRPRPTITRESGYKFGENQQITKSPSSQLVKSTTASCLEETTEDQGTDLPVAQQQPNLHDEREATNRRKDTSEYPVDKEHMDPKDENLEVNLANGAKKFATRNRGWSYKGRGRWTCRVQTTGCFNAAPANMSNSFALLVDSSLDMTDSKCILQCSKRMRIRKFVFAGLRNGNVCRCAEKPYYIIDPNKKLRNECNTPCTGDKSRKCGGPNGITALYMIKSKCIEDEPLDKVIEERSIVGCYPKPHNLEEIMEEYTIDDITWRAARCILQCEDVGLVLAISIQPNHCYCGLTDRRFNLLNPVNVTYCSQDQSDYMMVYRTKSEDKRCGQKRFLKAGELHRKVGLITFPGSGNTWIRHLIESATGIYTGSVYHDANLINGGYIGELLPPESYKVAVVKSHHQMLISEMKYLDALINVYRNPYEAILSEYNRRNTGHIGSIDRSKFDVEGLSDLVSGTISKWYMTTKVVLRNSNLPSFVFSYNELLNNPLLSAEKMARFIMGNTLDEEDLQRRLSCMYLTSMGEFKRKKRYDDFDPYPKKDKDKINLKIVELDKELKKFHKPTILHYIRSIDERYEPSE